MAGYGHVKDVSNASSLRMSDTTYIDRIINASRSQDVSILGQIPKPVCTLVWMTSWKSERRAASVCTMKTLSLTKSTTFIVHYILRNKVAVSLPKPRCINFMKPPSHV